MRHHHHRPKKASIWRWVPVAIAVALIIAAFVIAPSLQPPPPRTQITTPLAVQDLGRSLAEPRPPERADASPGSPEGSPTPQGAIAQRPEAAPAQPSESSKRRPKRRAASPARPTPPPAQDDASADLNVRWNRAN